MELRTVREHKVILVGPNVQITAMTVLNRGKMTPVMVPGKQRRDEHDHDADQGEQDGHILGLGDAQVIGDDGALPATNTWIPTGGCWTICASAALKRALTSLSSVLMMTVMAVSERSFETIVPS